MSLVCLLQADVDARIAKLEGEESESSSSSSSESEGSDSSSTFGLQKKGKQPQKKKGTGKNTATGTKDKEKTKKEKETPKTVGTKTDSSSAVPVPTPISAAAQAPPLPDNVSQASGGPGKLPVLLEKANQALVSLQQVTTPAMWLQTIKCKDIDTRVQRACDVASRLQGRTSDAVALETATQLEAEVNRASRDHEVVKALHSNSFASLDDQSDILTAMLDGLSDDNLVVILTDIAKRLVEARFSSFVVTCVGFQCQDRTN